MVIVLSKSDGWGWVFMEKWQIGVELVVVLSKRDNLGWTMVILWSKSDISGWAMVILLSKSDNSVWEIVIFDKQKRHPLNADLTLENELSLHSLLSKRGFYIT